MVSNFIKLLKILDIDVNRLLVVNKPVKFRSIIFPDESFFLDDSGDKYQNAFFTADAFFTKEYIETVDRIRDFALKNCTRLDKKKYYFYHGRNQVDEERIANYFHSKGYEIVQPEKLPLEAQLNILVNCESFASTLGSCTHNAIFLRDNSEVIIIPRWIKIKLNSYQQALNQLHNLQVVYIDSTFSIYSPEHTGPYCYVLSRQLKEYFGDNAEYNDEDFATFLMYVRHAVSHNLPMHAEAVKYYGGDYAEFYIKLQQRQDLMQKFGVRLQ